LAEAAQLAKSSTRTLLRQARARYTCDVLTWPYREEFLAVWSQASYIPGWFSEPNAALFYTIVRAERPSSVVEIGSYLGKSTVFLALALRQLNPRGTVVAIDPHTGDRQQLEGLRVERLPSFDLFCQHCRAANVEDLVDARVTTSLEAARDWSSPVDLLYIDGWHSYDAVTADGKAWLPHLSSAGVVVFDDYRAYQEVADAVTELDRAGDFHMWGVLFGQAVGGALEQPPPQIARALRLAPGMLPRWVRRRIGGDR
jgi:predicted O-methyltransferase YrrM